MHRTVQLINVFDVTREVRTFYNNVFCISKTSITNLILARYACFIYQNNTLQMDNCITTTIHVFDCANYNKIHIKCMILRQNSVSRVTKTHLKNVQKRVILFPKVFNQIQSKYSGIMTLHVDITNIILVKTSDRISIFGS